jgi:uncharacterized protein
VPGWLTAADGDVLLTVRVQPRASRTEIAGEIDGAVKIRLASPPVDGAANRALVAFLAKRLGRPKTAIRIERGERARSKVVRVCGLGPAEALARLTPG